MSLVLIGTLRAPYPDDPAEMGALEWAQARAAMRDAAAEIERLRALVEFHEESNVQSDQNRAAAYRMAFPSQSAR